MTAERPQQSGDVHADLAAGRALRCMWWIGGAAFAAVALALYVRLYFAIDFSDESFYVALPWAFTLGHRPIADEVAIHQFAAMLFTPLVRLFLLATGSVDGLFLYTRHLYFLLAVGAAAVAARYLARLVGVGAALLVAACVVAYVPFNLPNLGYNTIGSLGLVAGLFWLASSGVSRHPAADQFCGTLALAAATIAYPPLALATGPAVLVAVWQLHGRGEVARPPRVQRSLVPALVAAGLAGGWLLLELALYADADSLRRLSELNDAIGLQGGAESKLALLGRQLANQAGLLVSTGMIVAAIAAILRWLPSAFAACALLLAGPAFYVASSAFGVVTQPQRTVTSLVVFALATLPFLPRAAPSGWERHWAGIRMICGASFAAGLAISWGSANGMQNAVLGLLPATLIGIALIAQLGTGPSRAGRAGAAPLVALLLSYLAFAVSDLYDHVYRDYRIPELVAVVEEGAYAGIRTRPERARFIAQLSEDLEAARCLSDTVLFLDYFPAGYLLSDLRPRTATVWMFFLSTEKPNHHPTRAIYAAPFEHGDLPHLVVDMRMTLLAWDQPASRPGWDPVRLRLALGGYEDVVERREYTIRRLPGRGLRCVRADLSSWPVGSSR